MKDDLNITHPDIERAEKEGGPIMGTWDSDINKYYHINCFWCGNPIYEGEKVLFKGGHAFCLNCVKDELMKYL